MPPPVSTRLHLCRSDFVAFLAREAANCGLAPLSQGPSWVLTPSPPANSLAAAGLCFAHMALVSPKEFNTPSVNSIAHTLVEEFLDSCRDERFEHRWPLDFRSDESVLGLPRRSVAVEGIVLKDLSKRISRVIKLARGHPTNPTGPARGLFVYFPDFDSCWFARDAVYGGQRRMADDEGAPSRSYLKVEEAYGVLGHDPQPGETVADLGAAPGGWSYSAAKRGASVLALDNGPLKGAALGHPLIRHEQSDAFRHQPASGKAYDWLFCDVVDDPYKVLALLEQWVANRWCERFIVNLKFGRTDPLPLLHRVVGLSSPLTKQCSILRARHLFHDREEFTVVGELKS